MGYNTDTRLRKATRKKESEEFTMKNYKINFAANTVTVTKDFLKKAEQLGTVEFNTMMELRKLGMTITIKQ